MGRLRADAERTSEAADFIASLPIAAQKKVLRLLEEVARRSGGPFEIKNEQKFKRLEPDIYELKSDQVRLLFFLDGPRRLVITHGFLKKAQKTPPVEIGRAQRWMQLYKQERGR